MSYFGKYFISGKDAQKAVDWIFTNDLHKPEGINNKSPITILQQF